jgi:5-methyltetrahydropteroyltriglutamate--homocysteine methyltransferase
MNEHLPIAAEGFANALRADQVGSLLRPAPLLQARIDHGAGRLDAGGLREEEDRAVLDALRRQRDCGIDILTDGELRRASFMTGVTDRLAGYVDAEIPALPWRGGPGAEPPTQRVRVVASTLRPAGRIAEGEAAFLLEHARGPFKVTLPSPLQLAFRAHRSGFSDIAYPTRTDLIADLARIVADEARLLAESGVPYVQVDAPAYALWMSPDLLDAIWGGDDLDRLLDAAIAGDNLVLDAARAAGAITAVHVCRGNRMGRWLADGGYDPIAERLFTGLRCHRLLLEYDSPRAGSFAPLRFVPPAKVVVLGLVTTKSGELESSDDLFRRIDKASRIVPLEQLALSPQCGFASSIAGNPITPDDQWRKLELVASVAREVWP